MNTRGLMELVALNVGLDLRVSTVPALHGENLVLRIMSLQADLPKLEQMGLHWPQVELLASTMQGHQGCVIVTGPTGSGKSTTLAAMIDKINRERKGHIITVEDPVEYQLLGVGQALENDTAQPLGSGTLVTLGQAAETDTAQIILPRHFLTLAQVIELDTAGGYNQNAALSERYRYDVPAGSLRFDIPAGSLRFDIPGGSLRFDVPSMGAGITVQ